MFGINSSVTLNYGIYCVTLVFMPLVFMKKQGKYSNIKNLYFSITNVPMFGINTRVTHNLIIYGIYAPRVNEICFRSDRRKKRRVVPVHPTLVFSVVLLVCYM